MKIRCQCTKCKCQTEFELITKESLSTYFMLYPYDTKENTNKLVKRIGKTVCVRCEAEQH